MFDSHMLCHWSFSSIWFLTIGNRADIFSLNLICTSSVPLFLVFSWRILILLNLCHHHFKLLYLLVNVRKLHIEYIICKMQFICLLLIEKESAIELSVKKINMNGFILGELIIIPFRISLILIFLSPKQTFFNFFFHIFVHTLSTNYNNCDKNMFHRSSYKLMNSIYNFW